jgi:hypothetical protein
MSSYQTSLSPSSANEIEHVYRYVCVSRDPSVDITIAIAGGAAYKTNSWEAEDKKVSFL